MSNMKRFTIWLARCIFQKHMTDEAIISAAAAAWDATSPDWVRAQIEIAKKEPLYKELSHHE